METLSAFWNVVVQIYNENTVAIWIGLACNAAILSFVWVGRGIFKYVFRGLIPRWYRALRRRNRVHIVRYVYIPEWRRFYEKGENDSYRIVILFLLLNLYFPILAHTEFRIPKEFGVHSDVSRESIVWFAQLIFGIGWIIIGAVIGQYLKYFMFNAVGENWIKKRALRQRQRNGASHM